METIIERDYCIKNPAKIIRLFGLDIYFNLLFKRNKGLLELLTDKYYSGGIPIPGSVGNSYKLSALIEFRVARIYKCMAEQFSDHADARELFMDLYHEEMEHGRLMLLCYYTVEMSPSLQFLPSLRDPEIQNTLHDLKAIERKVHSYSLDRALDITKELELGEVNVIFGRLLSQVDQAQCRLFKEEFKKVENHSESVPRRIRELRAAAT